MPACTSTRTIESPAAGLLVVLSVTVPETVAASAKVAARKRVAVAEMILKAFMLACDFLWSILEFRFPGSERQMQILRFAFPMLCARPQTAPLSMTIPYLGLLLSHVSETRHGAPLVVSIEGLQKQILRCVED